LGTLALNHERQRAQMSETENGRLGLHGTKHLKSNHLITLGFKGLIAAVSANVLILCTVSVCRTTELFTKSLFLLYVNTCLHA